MAIKHHICPNKNPRLTSTYFHAYKDTTNGGRALLWFKWSSSTTSKGANWSLSQQIMEDILQKYWGITNHEYAFCDILIWRCASRFLHHKTLYMEQWIPIDTHCQISGHNEVFLLKYSTLSLCASALVRVHQAKNTQSPNERPGWLHHDVQMDLTSFDPVRLRLPVQLRSSRRSEREARVAHVLHVAADVNIEARFAPNCNKWRQMYLPRFLLVFFLFL